MSIARLASTRSTCLRRQVGAVIVKDKKILATGYNGAPMGLKHCLDIGCLREELGIPSGHQQEALDGVGFMPVDVVGMPAVDQFVEPLILDIPALVAEGDGAPGGNGLLGKRGDPDPVAGQRLVFTVELSAHRTRFLRTDDPHRNIHRGPGKQARKIPP